MMSSLRIDSGGETTRGGVNAFALKMIAIIGMTTDHIGTVFEAQLPLWLRCLLFLPGGMTFPIMAFLLAEGYRHTKNVKKYGQRLFVFALISLIPFRWASGNLLNVMFTLLLGLIVLYCYDHMMRELFWLIFAGAEVVSYFCDWYLVGIPMILLYHIVDDPKLRVGTPILFPWFMFLPTFVDALSSGGFDSLKFLLPVWCYVYIGCSLTIPLLLRYNGERGYKFKWGFYIYYPAHLLVLAILYGLLLGDFRLYLLFIGT